MIEPISSIVIIMIYSRISMLNNSYILRYDQKHLLPQNRNINDNEKNNTVMVIIRLICLQGYSA